MLWLLANWTHDRLMIGSNFLQIGSQHIIQIGLIIWTSIILTNNCIPFWQSIHSIASKLLIRTHLLIHARLISSYWLACTDIIVLRTSKLIALYSLSVVETTLWLYNRRRWIWNECVPRITELWGLWRLWGLRVIGNWRRLYNERGLIFNTWLELLRLTIRNGLRWLRLLGLTIWRFLIFFILAIGGRLKLLRLTIRSRLRFLLLTIGKRSRWSRFYIVLSWLYYRLLYLWLPFRFDWLIYLRFPLMFFYMSLSFAIKIRLLADNTIYFLILHTCINDRQWSHNLPWRKLLMKIIIFIRRWTALRRTIWIQFFVSSERWQ